MFIVDDWVYGGFFVWICFDDWSYGRFLKVDFMVILIGSFQFNNDFMYLQEDDDYKYEYWDEEVFGMLRFGVNGYYFEMDMVMLGDCDYDDYLQ